MPNLSPFLQTGIWPALNRKIIAGGAAGAHSVAGIVLGDGLASVTVQPASSQALVNALRTGMLYRVMSYPGFAIHTNFDVQNVNAVSYAYNGVLKNLAAASNFDTGTSQVIATNGKWSSALLTVDSSNNPVLTWSATLNANTEALAIAAFPAVPANNLPLGYITVQSSTATGGHTWTAGTDALTTGTGGNPANATNYYNDPSLNGTYGVAAVASIPGVASVTDLTSEFTITADGVVDNTGGTDTTGSALVFTWFAHEVHPGP